MFWLLLHIIHFKNEWERPMTLFRRYQQPLTSRATEWKKEDQKKKLQINFSGFLHLFVARVTCIAPTRNISWHFSITMVGNSHFKPRQRVDIIAWLMARASDWPSCGSLQFLQMQSGFKRSLSLQSSAAPLAVLLTDHSPKNSFKLDYPDDQGLRKTPQKVFIF